jgi:Predicted membrane protein (DUF2207) N-terminal domain
MRRVLPLLVLAALVLVPSALAKSYTLAAAYETFAIRPDGSVLVLEQLTFSFDGHFHGAYRLVPSTAGQTITNVSVAEGGVPYRPGADAAVGSAGEPGTFGVLQTPQGWTQIAWHFDTVDAIRTFTVSYTLHGYVDVYRDVGNLYLQVWGGQWPVGLGQLHAQVVLPGAVTKSERDQFRGWGHPASVSGKVTLASRRRVTLDATAVPASQFVEADVVFPRRLLDPSLPSRSGDGLSAIVQREAAGAPSPYGPTPAPVASNGGSSGSGEGIVSKLLLWLLVPIVFLGRMFGFFGAGRSGRGGGAGFGGSFSGSGGGGGGGGGGGAW